MTAPMRKENLAHKERTSHCIHMPSHASPRSSREREREREREERERVRELLIQIKGI